MAGGVTHAERWSHRRHRAKKSGCNVTSTSAWGCVRQPRSCPAARKGPPGLRLCWLQPRRVTGGGSRGRARGARRAPVQPPPIGSGCRGPVQPPPIGSGRRGVITQPPPCRHLRRAAGVPPSPSEVQEAPLHATKPCPPCAGTGVVPKRCEFNRNGFISELLSRARNAIYGPLTEYWWLQHTA